MENKHFQTPGVISGVSTLKDKTLKLTVYVSRELAGEEKARLFDLEQQEGWFLFSPNSFQPKDIPQEPAKISTARKSPTERLYGVLYVYWQQNYSGQNSDFNSWRETEMEKLIQDYKNKLY